MHVLYKMGHTPYTVLNVYPEVYWYYPSLDPYSLVRLQMEASFVLLVHLVVKDRLDPRYIFPPRDETHRTLFRVWRRINPVRSTFLIPMNKSRNSMDFTIIEMNKNWRSSFDHFNHLMTNDKLKDYIKDFRLDRIFSEFHLDYTPDDELYNSSPPHDLIRL